MVRHTSGMKMKTLKAMLILAMLPLACLGQSTGLSTRVTLHGFHKFERKSLFEFFAQRSGLQLRIEDNAFGVQDPDRPTVLGVFAVFRDIPIRYPLSWALHFSPDVSAELKDEILVVRPSGGQQELSPELQACSEPAGSWTNSFSPDAIITTQQESEEWNVVQLFSYLCHRLGADNFVVDPALAMQEQTVTVALNGRTVRDVMTILLEKANASVCYQGGVLFLTRRTGNAQQRRP